MTTNEKSKLFYVGHQKVSIDVDLSECCIQGWTELMIIPTDASLKQIRLDCRQSKVHDVLINNRKVAFHYNDMLQTDKPVPGSTVYQFHQYSKKIEDLMSDSLPGELVIQLPKGFRILPQDQPTTASGDGAVPNPIDPSYYKPLVVKIEFSCSSPTSGFSFIGGKDSNVLKSYWHAYTTHSPIGQATSNWLPCIDGLWELCTWEVEISVPRTIQDIGNPQLAGLTSDSTSVAEGSGQAEEYEREIVVVCNNTSPLEVCLKYGLNCSFRFLTRSPILLIKAKKLYRSL
jgi:transcription initiation factor TFIID subunit 2